MRNALNKLADTVSDPAEKKVSAPQNPTHLQPAALSYSEGFKESSVHYVQPQAGNELPMDLC